MFGIAREKWQRKLLPALAVALAVLAVAWLGTATDAAPTVASGAEATAATAPANSARAPSTEAVQPDRLTPNQRVDALFNQRFKPGAPGAAVLVARDGKILLEKSYGLADAESHTPIGPTTKFRIGSITKQFTAAAILKLVDEGKLSLEDKLARFIPDYPRGQEVSIHHLLSHTSGIPNFTSKWSFIFNVTQAVEPEEQIASFKRDPYDFDPGARWAYSNSGYFLLGYIVQKVSQRTYEEYLRKTFFEPLGMPDTGVHRAGAALKNEALGYAFHGDTFKRATDWNMSRAGGAGALYSTVRDLYRWNEAVFNDRVLKPATLANAFTPVRTGEDDASKPKDTGYGYGWFIGRIGDRREIAHGGGLQGFVSYLTRLPDQKMTVVVLMNSAPPPAEANPGKLGRQIVEIYLAK